MHKNGKIVAVWLDGNCPEEKYKEGEEFYLKLLDMGVDILTTDWPIQAREFFQSLSN